MTTGGIVLCGGRSSRMGRPKAWLPFGDETLLQRVVRILGNVVDPIIVVAAPAQDLPPLPAGVQVVHDECEHLGPLAGLTGGLAALCHRVDAAYLSSCDVPFLQPAFVSRIISLLGDAALALPQVDGYLHPLAGVYRTDCLPTAQQLLAAGQLRLLSLCDALPHRIVTAQEIAAVDPTFQSLRNLNTPENYAEALRDAQGYL